MDGHCIIIQVGTWSCLLLLVWSLVTMAQHTQGARQRKRKPTAEEQLMMDLFRGYDNDARAVINPGSTVTVSIDFLLLRLQRLDERSQVLMTTGLIITEWYDERLTWNPLQYGNISDVVVRAGRIWTPELAIINGADNIIQEEFGKIRVLISHDGKVHWEPGGVFATTCDIDITYFPFDSQRCPIEIGAWSYKSDRMNLTNTRSEMETQEFKKNGEWDIKGTQAKWTRVILPCCPDMRYSKVVFYVMMNRRYMFYVMNIILPCVLLSVLILIVFCVPPDAGEKISSGISVLLAFTVFLLMLADNVPRTSLDVPILVIYLGTTMGLGTASVCLSVVVLHFHHRGHHGPVPNWARTLFLKNCARTFCLGREVSLSRDESNSRAHPNSFRVDDFDACDMLEMHQQILQPGSGSADSKGRSENIVFHRHGNNVSTHYHHMDSSPHSSTRVTQEEVVTQHTLEENIKEWHLLARVLDRIFFTVVFTIMFFCAFLTLLSPWYTQW